jgi:hypothetical protein
MLIRNERFQLRSIMKSNSPSRLQILISILITLMVLVAPLRAQQTTPPARPAPAQPAVAVDPSFDNLLAADAYKLYGEVRNLGTLLSTGGAGEIVDPIIKLADPGPQFKSIVDFLKKNSEALGSSRLMFASWPARTDVPMFFVAIDFPTTEDANKFAPKLETFMPTILPPVPDATPETSAAPNSTNDKATAKASPSPAPSPAEHLPFVITRRGNLVCISDKSFKFEKLHPPSGKNLFQDPNFRVARDQFASESIFFFMNVALEDKTRATPSPTPVITAAEQQKQKAEVNDESADETAEEAARRRAGASEPTPDPNVTANTQAVLVAMPTPSPTPTPTKEQQAQRIATNQIGSLLDAIGYGEEQDPEAVGFALSLDGNEYILRALIIDKPDAKKLLIPFIPQLQSGPPLAADAASVLPDDTEVLVSASVDLQRTYEGMRKAAEQRAKANPPLHARVAQDGTLIAQRSTEPEPDVFTQFEKKAGFNIKEDLLPALGSEIAMAGSLKGLQSMGGFGMGMPFPSSPAVVTEPGADKEGEKGDAKNKEIFPVLLIEVKDRDGARRLLPKVLNGLGIGEANLIAQTERREDTEMVNYAGVFAYAFVGNFVVISDAPTVRRVIDANLKHQTLSSNTVFRNSRRWESRGTLGHIYVSPALMEGYQNQVRQQSATMNAELRDFLLGLNPNSEAITYAVSNDGLGIQHELHLPKNLILTMVAGISSAVKNPPPEQNEMISMGILGFVANLEEQYKTGPGKGSYGSRQQLIDAKMFQPEQFEKYGYKFEITATSDSFEATETQCEYGKTGRRSFIVDKTGVVRGDDHGGAPATVADKPVQQ